MDGVQELYLVLMLVDDRNVICDSTYFSANGTSYHRVCGRARGYQKGNTHGFNGYHRLNQTSILMTAMPTACISLMAIYVATYGLMLLDSMTILQIQFQIVNVSCWWRINPSPFVGNNCYCESDQELLTNKIVLSIT